MNVDLVITEIATQLNTIEKLNVRGYVPGAISPPTAIVSFPDTYTYDDTYGRGYDVMTFQVWVLVSRASDRAARKNLARFVNGSGPSSVKQVLETRNEQWQNFDLLVVKSVEFDVMEVNAVEFLSAIFTLQVSGKGAP